MRRLCPWQPAWIVAAALFGVLAAAPAQAQAPVPDDDTSVGAGETEKTSVAKAEQDDATWRLESQRAAWGVVTPAFRTHALEEGRKHGRRRNARAPRWVNIGPTDADFEQNGSFTGHVRDSGRARTILPHPTNPDIVYFLTSGGGLWGTLNWRSSDTKWFPLTDNLPTTGGGSVAFGRHPTTLYLGLGDPYDQILVGGSMVRSRTGGLLWSEEVELGNAVSVRDVKVDTSTNRDIVLVATDSGLYRSADDGETYAPVATFAGMSVWSIERTSAGWLASAQPCDPIAVGLRCGQATTLFVSTDRGATWAPITNAGNVFAANGRTTLGVARPGESVVYAYANNVTDGALKDVYRSTDGGQTWVAQNVGTKVPTNANPSQTNMNICGGQCWYNQSILVDPTDASRNTVWVGGQLATATTKDGGASWAITTWWLYSEFPELPYAHADHHAAAFKTTGKPTIILGNDGGLNISEDGGATFSSDKNRGLATHLYYTVAGNPEFPNLVIGGLQDNGTRLRTDNGSTHNQVIGGDGMGAAYSQANTNTVMGSSQGSGIRTNLSNTPPEVFQNWVARGALSDSAGAGFFTAVLPAPANLDPTGRVFFHFTNSRVWRSNNGGLTWNLIGSATPPTSPGLPPTRRFRSSPYNIGVSPSDLNRIAVGAAGGFLDITINGGATWTDIDLITKVPGYAGFVTNVTWQDNQTLWITAVAQAAGSVRVIKAVAGPGDDWANATFTPMQNGLPDLPITRVYVDPRDATRQTLYAATHVGIYATKDGGANWDEFGNGLPTVRVNDIYMPPDGGFIRIATYGRGVWELPQLEFVRASLDDDRRSCDRDDVLDNGEKGELKVTLKNQGLRTVSRVELTITSSNPHVTFPRGNVMHFPPVHGRGERTGSIDVALSGAAGIESVTFQIAIDAPELALPGPFNVTSTHRVNFDERAASSATESSEGSVGAWTVAGDAPNSPNIAPWQRRTLAPLDHVWWGPDNNGQNDDTKDFAPDEQILTSPMFQVGAGNLSLSFRHRFAFEGGNWDGGVLEINDGSGWKDVELFVPGVYNGSTNAVTSAPIGASRRAFVVRNAGWPNFVNAAVNLGAGFAGKAVQFRFRIGADESTGAPGWDVDDIAVAGATTLPFASLVAETSSCSGSHGHD